MSTIAEAWLTIPPTSSVLLGGARWSHRCDAIENAAGQTIALSVELEQVFDGLFAEGAAPPFAYVISLLRLMKFGSSDPKFDRLAQAYSRARGAAALSRHAGILIRELCHNLATKYRPSLSNVLQAMQTMQRYGERRRTEPTAAQRPRDKALVMADGLEEIGRQLTGYSDDDLDNWLHCGCGDKPDSTPIEEALESLPVRVLKLLAAVRRNQRLVGAASLIPALDAALSLPPRKQLPDALPQGGYADVTTHGDLERLLPSQFALEPDDFIRRFAERELLYFKREEPHATQKPDRVIVLDQGVRTWGRVRLALSGAALSLLKTDTRRVGDVRIHFTSAPHSVDLRRRELDSITAIFEASDLTPQPAEAFARALEDVAESAPPRDLVLLSHARNLTEPLAEAKRRRRPEDRIFTVSVAESGLTTLDELLDEGLRPVRSFRLDLAAAESVTVQKKPKLAREAPGKTWTGDVEPIGFPFRPGLISEPEALTFSADGEWLVIQGRGGVLQALTMDGAPPEVLPRAFTAGKVMEKVESVLGVHEGVVVCGRMPLAAHFETVTIASPSGALFESLRKSESNLPESFQIQDSPHEVFVAAHYDFPSRKVRLYQMGSTANGARWVALPDCHCLVMLPDNDEPYLTGTVVNLTHGTISSESNREIVQSKSRANEPLVRARMSPPPPYRLQVVEDRSQVQQIGRPYVYLEANSLLVEQAQPQWEWFEPVREGQNLLADHIVNDARLAGNVLAICLGKSNQTARTLLLMKGPEGIYLSTHTTRNTGGAFNLSPDGSRLARRFGKKGVAVYDVNDSGNALTAGWPAKLHNKVQCIFESFTLRFELSIGNYSHSFQVQKNQLSHHCEVRPVEANRTATALAGVERYDPSRFPATEATQIWDWRLIVDRWGAVHLLWKQDRLVASFLVRRKKAAAWLPDGTYWGDASLIGGPPHPNAAARIGAALKEIWKDE